MENNSNFSIQRIGWLIRSDVWEALKIIAIITLAVFGFGLFIAFVLPDSSSANRNFPHDKLYGNTLFVGGFVLTSVIFRELYTKPRGQFYLTLPASHAEKLISKWLLTAILFPIAVTLLYWLYDGIVHSIFTLISEQGYPTNRFSDEWASSKFRQLPFIYIVLQSVLFLGAITFTKYNIFKTGFSLFACAVGLLIIALILFRFIMWDYFDGMQFPNSEMRALIPSKSFQENIVKRIPIVAKFLFWFVLAPYLLLVSYFKLKEREI